MAKTRLGFSQSVVTGGLSVPRCRDKVMESSGRLALAVFGSGIARKLAEKRQVELGFPSYGKGGPRVCSIDGIKVRRKFSARRPKLWRLWGRESFRVCLAMASARVL